MNKVILDYYKQYLFSKFGICYMGDWVDNYRGNTYTGVISLKGAYTGTSVGSAGIRVIKHQDGFIEYNEVAVPTELRPIMEDIYKNLGYYTMKMYDEAFKTYRTVTMLLELHGVKNKDGVVVIDTIGISEFNYKGYPWVAKSPKNIKSAVNLLTVDLINPVKHQLASLGILNNNFAIRYTVLREPFRGYKLSLYNCGSLCCEICCDDRVVKYTSGDPKLYRELISNVGIIRAMLKYFDEAPSLLGTVVGFYYNFYDSSMLFNLYDGKKVINVGV